MNEYANRYQVVRDSFWWRVKTGDGTRLAGKFHTEKAAMQMAAEMLTAFMDGKFVGERPPEDAVAPCYLDNELILRRLLAFSYSLTRGLYMDDGELQDNSVPPFIDFKRDDPREIERKMVERGYKKNFGADSPERTGG